MSVSETLRKALQKQGDGVRAISRASGVDVAVVSRFMAGAGLRSENLDALAAHCGLVLVAKKGKSRKGR